MAYELPSTTPEKSSGNKSATNAASDKQGGKPEKQFKPTQTSKRKKPRLSVGERLELAGSLILVPWLWSDLIDCQRFSKLFFDALALCFAHGVVCYFLAKFLKSARWGIVIWIALTVLTASVVCKNSRQLTTNVVEPKPFEVVQSQVTNQTVAPLTATDIKKVLHEELASHISVISETNVVSQTNIFIQTNEPFAKEWEPPPLPEGCDVISVTYGESESSNPIQMGLNIIAGRSYDTNGQTITEVLVGAHVKNNRLYVEATIPGDFPFGPFKISGNKIIGRLPATWQMNYDDDAVEIVNAFEIPVCQIFYKRPDVVEIYGVFGNQFQIEILTPNSLLRSLPPQDWYDRGKFDCASMGLNRIFKYPFWAYRGQRVQNNE
jgi:hypothetical protein